jgi:L-threonylcarbamoyladenylate synthase
VPKLVVDPAACAVEEFAEAVAWLRRGEVVAVPTDTLYGLAVDPASSAAVQRLFELKRRAADAAVPLIAASMDQVQHWIGTLSPLSWRLAVTFWPGPLSLVLDAPAQLAPEVHGGRASVAIRVPAHRVATMLCAAWGGPLTATSANRSGDAPAASVDALGDLATDPRLYIIDAGRTAGGAPSTIVDARGRAPILVRDGAIAWNRVLESLKE